MLLRSEVISPPPLLRAIRKLAPITARSCRYARWDHQVNVDNALLEVINLSSKTYLQPGASMYRLKPLNRVAERAIEQEKTFLSSRSGLIVKTGDQACWSGRVSRSIRRASEGETIAPTGTRRVVIGFEGKAALSDNEVRELLASPQTGTFPVFDVTLRSGMFALRISQVALGLGIVYLVAGALVGVATPTALHYASLFYGGGQTPAARERVKAVINDFSVEKESVIDERTKKFFDAVRAAKADGGKEQE